MTMVFISDIPMADVPLSVIVASEAGECVHQVFNQPAEYIGQVIGLSSDERTVSEIAALLTNTLNHTTVVDGQVHSQSITTAQNA